ncbi:MAG TPA: carboxypeptidase-like regulatory domain-containing protein [Bryobacteraceae bacterium]|nr:carboxypeptidase-like regulatory domain-containing protein [Bryobacteraceae bacterium]
MHFQLVAYGPRHLQPPAVLAQDYRAIFQGTDSSGALAPGAKVTLLNVNTGIATIQSSNGQRQYGFGLVEPGTYRVTAERNGFAKAVADNMKIETQGDATVDFTLQPGSITETVAVTASPVELQFNTSTKDLTLTSRQTNSTL